MNYTLRQVVVGSCIAVVAGIIDGTIMFFGHVQEGIPLAAIIAITFLAGIISATVDNEWER